MSISCFIRDLRVTRISTRRGQQKRFHSPSRLQRKGREESREAAIDFREIASPASHQQLTDIRRRSAFTLCIVTRVHGRDEGDAEAESFVVLGVNRA